MLKSIAIAKRYVTNWFKTLWRNIARIFKKEATYPSISKPIIINVSNNTEEEKTATLFGTDYNLFGAEGKKRFGNEEGISVSPAISRITYEQILLGLIGNSLNITLIYIQNTSQGTLPDSLAVVQKDMFGRERHDPVNIKVDICQYQSSIADAPCDFKLNAQTSIEIKVPAGVTYQVSLYPSNNGTTK